MNKKKNLLIAISFLLGSSSLSACSVNNPYSTSKGSSESTEKVIYIGKGQKGASISFKINIKDNKSFSSKAINTTTTASGNVPKTSADIDHFVVYLIKNSVSSNYASDNYFDPIGDSVFSQDPIDKSSTKVTFRNVPGSGEKYYYVAVRAIDGSGNDILIKNYSWTGITVDAPYFRRVAVSYGEGVQVSDTFKITNGNFADLPVAVNLDDAIGATIGSDITINPGSNSLTFAVKNATPEIKNLRSK